MPYERLTALDSAFLHVEGPTSPMHVGSIGIFEGAPFKDERGRFRLDEVRAQVAARLHHVPRFRQRLLPVPLAQGRPVWVDDDTLDLAYHVRLTALPTPGDDDQLRALMARIQAQPLDRRRPLWELWFVEGLEGGRVGLIQKTHHAMVDGISGVDVALLLLDVEPSPPPPDPPPPWQPVKPPSAVQLLWDAMTERVTDPVEVARSMRAALRAPGAIVSGITGIGRTLRSVTATAPRMPFNGPVGPHRRWELARVDFELVRGITRASGATVNDVVLAAVTGALREWLVGAGIAVDDLNLTAMVPVSVRTDAQRGELGNQVSAMTAELPVHLADAGPRLRAVQDQMTMAKASGESEGAEEVLALLNVAPPILLNLAARLLPMQRAVNLVVTNIPGPQTPLYCMGARMLEAFPYVGIADGMGLVVAVVSYDGQLGFGLTSDRDLEPDLGVLAERIEKAFADLANVEESA